MSVDGTTTLSPLPVHLDGHLHSSYARNPLLQTTTSSPFLTVHTPKKLSNGTAKNSNRMHRTSKHSSLLMSTWTLLNDVVTTGIVALPYYMMESGIGLGIVIIAVYGILSAFTLHLLYYLSCRYHVYSLVELCERAFGKIGYVTACTFMFIFNWGGYITTLIVLGTILPDLLNGWFGSYAGLQRTPVLIISVCLFAPIAYFKSLARFSWVAMGAVASILFLSLILIIQFFRGFVAHDDIGSDQYQRDAPEHAYRFWQNRGMAALGGISYLYTCHDMWFHVFDSLSHPTPRRVSIVANTSMALMALMAILVGFAGYLLFFFQTDDNILDNFTHTNTLINVCRLFLTLSICCCIPYNMYMPRVAVLSIIKLYLPDLVLKRDGNRMKRTIVHVILTTLLLGVGLIIALNVTDLGFAYQLVGGVSGISISLLIPASCYLRLHHLSHDESHTEMHHATHEHDGPIIPYETLDEDQHTPSHITTSMLRVDVTSDDMDSDDDDIRLTQDTTSPPTPELIPSVIIMPEANYVIHCWIVIVIGLFAMIACILTLTTNVFD